MIVVFAADIVMLGHRQLIGKKAFFILVHLVFQDELDGLIIIAAITQRSSAGAGQTLMTRLFSKAQDTDAGAVGLFGMLLAVKYFQNVEPD